jgi:hypothetical protein
MVLSTDLMRKVGIFRADVTVDRFNLFRHVAGFKDDIILAMTAALKALVFGQPIGTQGCAQGTANVGNGCCELQAQGVWKLHTHPAFAAYNRQLNIAHSPLFRPLQLLYHAFDAGYPVIQRHSPRSDLQ